MPDVMQNFSNLGDWLIWRSTGLLGDFRLLTCAQIILNESIRDNWRYRVSKNDISRILARYREHVGFWNISLDVIRQELSQFAQSLGLGQDDIYRQFDSSLSQRFPVEGPYEAVLIIENSQFVALDGSSTISIRIGGRVTWIMQDRRLGLSGDVDYHNVVADNGEFKSPILRFGNRFLHTFAQAGQFGYHCESHPWMTGVVTVLAREL